MPKKYHLDQNNVAFLHCLNGAFAGMYTWLELVKKNGKKVPKKDLAKAFQEVVAKTNTALASEYIRGELIKKGVLENGDDTGLCLYDPSDDNVNDDADVYTNEELKTIRLEKDPTWVDNVKGL